MCVPDGLATMTEHTSLHNLCLFIKHLFATAFVQPDVDFELTEMEIDSDVETDSCFFFFFFFFFFFWF